MKIGVITDCFKKPHEEGIKMAAELGLDGVQIYATTGSFSPDTLTEEKKAEYKALLKEKGYAVSNIDATVIAQAPKLAPYIPNMIANIANALNVAESCINVKATTEEKLGFTGEKLGISAHAVCTLIS